jgi:hypothetical protein
MKTDKEYPATHSMETAWFASDIDGNVAIFQFEEDGPSPIPFTDMQSDDLMSLIGIKKNDVAVMPFSKEQIDELKRNLKPVHSINDISWNSNILINPTKFDTFIKAGVKFDLCYSEEEGFYHIYYIEKQSESIKKLIAEGDVYGVQECNIELYSLDNRPDKSEHRLAHFPFYVYEQGLYLNVAPERVVSPKLPFKVEQMPEKAKEYMFHLPVRFAEKEHLEPSEFIDSQCWLFHNHTKEVNGVKYMQVALTDGGFGYVKVKAYSDKCEISKEWESAPRIIDKSNDYIDIDD